MKTLSPEQQLRNVAQIVIEMTTPTRTSNGSHRAPSYRDDKATIASASLQLAQMVVQYLDGRLKAVALSDDVPF